MSNWYLICGDVHEGFLKIDDAADRGRELLNELDLNSFTLMRESAYLEWEGRRTRRGKKSKK